MKHIASCSFGKDSIATILLAIENNEPLDGAVFSEVMFDLARNISGENPDNMRARAEKKGYQNGTKFGSLESQVMYDPKCSHLLPTPNACDYNTTWSEEAKQECLRRRAEEGKEAYPSKFNSLRQLARENLLPTPLAVEVSHSRRVKELKDKGAESFHSRLNGESRPNSIMDFLEFHELLPTPTAIEGEKYTNTYNPQSQMGKSLSAMAGSGMLPTPAARDWKGRTNPGVVKEGSGCIYGETLPDAVERMTLDQKKDGKPFRLSPLFTEEMMGFPLMWTALPFLSQNGDQKQ